MSSRRSFVPITIGAIATALVASVPVSAQPIAPNEAVIRLFEREFDADWFTQAFLVQVPIGDVETYLDLLATEYGAFQRVVADGGDLFVRLERAELPTFAELDDQGRFLRLSFDRPIPIGGEIQTFVDAIAALPGRLSVLVTTDGEVVASYQPELLLGIASAFKLLVLQALDQAVAAGTLAWDDIAILEERHKSLPSGMIQDWPAGAPFTLATLAHLMIAISDNTATDILIEVVGRDTLEGLSPINTPFMTTGELFRLKSRPNEALAATWLQADTAGRRAIVDALADDPLQAQTQIRRPIPEIEWFFNTFELCALLAATSHLPMFDISPGVALASDWARIAHKAGSEPGFLNLSTLLTGQDGRQHCVVATWNSSVPPDAGALIPYYRSILRTLAPD